MAFEVFPISGAGNTEQSWNAALAGAMGGGRGVSFGGPGVVLSGWIPQFDSGLDVAVFAGSGMVGPFRVATDAAEVVTVNANATNYVCAKVALAGGLYTGVSFVAETAWPTDSATAKYVPIGLVVAGATSVTQVVDIRRMYANPSMIMAQTHLVPDTDFSLAHSPFGMLYNGTAARYFTLTVPPLNTAFDSPDDNPYRWLFVKLVRNVHGGGAVSVLPSSSWKGDYTSRVISATITTWRFRAANIQVYDQNPAITFRLSASAHASFKGTAVGILTNDYNLIPSPTYPDEV